MVELLEIIVLSLCALALILFISCFICLMIRLERNNKFLNEAMLDAYDELWREINKEEGKNEEDEIFRD